MTKYKVRCINWEGDSYDEIVETEYGPETAIRIVENKGEAKEIIHPALEYFPLANYCTCFDTLATIPLKGSSGIRPSVTCHMHKTLAERWDTLDSWEAFYAALDADREHFGIINDNREVIK